MAAVREAMAQGNLDGYPMAHAALADMHRRLLQPDEARPAYRRTLALTRQPADRRFLQRRLDDLG